MGEVAAVLIYDGECPRCRAAALWLLRRAEAGGATDLEILPWGSAVRRERFPAIAEDACAEAMQLILPDGRVLQDAAAAREILLRIPRWRWLTMPLDLRPGRPVYAWMARNHLKVRCRHRRG